MLRLLLGGSEQATWSRIGHGEDAGLTETSWEWGEGRGRLESYAEIEMSIRSSYTLSSAVALPSRHERAYSDNNQADQTSDQLQDANDEIDKSRPRSTA